MPHCIQVFQTLKHLHLFSNVAFTDDGTNVVDDDDLFVAPEDRLDFSFLDAIRSQPLSRNAEEGQGIEGIDKENLIDP